MRKMILFLVLCLLPAQVFAEDNELSGDTRLACEAILCLSSGDRPDECSPSLSRYFGISKKKWSDTIKARRNFLNQCPSSSEPNMPSLVEAILNGAGQCTAELLNRQLRRIAVIEECIPDKVWRRMTQRQQEETPRCRDKEIIIIDDTLPSYCKAYAGHEYTWKVGVHYVGEPLKSGRWIDE